MKENPRRQYFDSIAAQWDGWMNLDAIAAKLESGLLRFGLSPHEAVVDVGCGTGNLTAALLDRLSDEGRVFAVDISPQMIEEARKKIIDPRVEWLATDAENLPLPDSSIDRAICFSVWPHLVDPASAGKELLRVLKPGASLHVWHIDSREKINHIHAHAGEAVQGDVLDPAPVVASLLERLGFVVEDVVDDDEQYLVSAIRPS